jgi:F-type H+-transporting ATPase subunit epsilon
MTELHRPLEVRVVTPEGSLYKGNAGFVAAPALDGEIGILPGHTALLAVLGIGDLRICHGSLGGDVTDRFAVRGGFLQVVDDHVTLLVTQAIRPADLDATAIAAEREEVLAELRHPESDEAYESLLEQRHWVDIRAQLCG